ncbi:MAG: SDR family oxidoreductase [Ktedonobacteraceae bacterium]|nr:SDR family oxidoreductase [Ktedonobacteraceae bacterium]
MKVLIIGATSALAHEVAKNFARDGAELFLVARNHEKLRAVADDLKVRGAKRSDTYILDLGQLGQHQEMLDQAIHTLDGLDMLLIAHGTLGDQRLSEQNVEEALKEFTNNCTSVISLLTISANYFEKRRQGCIAVISSVAGDRGRGSNYVYGAAKAGVSAFLQGLRNRLAKKNVSVVTIKPGFIDTPMTAHMKKGLLMARADSVGKGVYEAMIKGKDVVYLPWFWRPIMFIIRSIPESIFKKLSL